MIISFFHRVFIKGNRRTIPASDMIAGLDDYLFHLRRILGDGAYPHQAKAYLDEWAGAETGFLRKFYPSRGEEAEYDLTPASEKVLEWVGSFAPKQFVGTEFRLLTVLRLLREIVTDAMVDPDAEILRLERVASCVDVNHLDGRIVYFKTVLKEEYESKYTYSNALCRKLEIKPETLFYDWLSNKLSIRFNAICCDDMTAFTLSGKADEDYNEQKFIQVKGIINRFKGREGRADLDNRWTKKVTDVRNWLMFSASERWRADNAEKEFFSDTSGKSGGQKEKLAYTILAAALAYQFGPNVRLEQERVRFSTLFDLLSTLFGYERVQKNP